LIADLPLLACSGSPDPALSARGRCDQIRAWMLWGIKFNHLTKK